MQVTILRTPKFREVKQRWSSRKLKPKESAINSNDETDWSRAAESPDVEVVLNSIKDRNTYKYMFNTLKNS